MDKKGMFDLPKIIFSYPLHSKYRPMLFSVRYPFLDESFKSIGFYFRIARN